MSAAVLVACIAAVNWQHPAGLVTPETLSEIGEKISSQEWARGTFENRKRVLEPWLNASYEDLREVFPKKRGNVYHNFSCPDDRSRLKFDPFNPRVFHCDTCGKDFAPETDAGIYPPDNRYHGTMYDGWACLYYLTASSVAADMALIGCVEGREAYLKRATEVLLLFADTIGNLPTVHKNEGDPACILTYHREGDNKVLSDLAVSYELLRGQLSSEQRTRIEEVILKRMLEDIMLQPEYTFDHNDIYQFHRTVLQTALALEREDVVDWSFGFGNYSPEKLPEHRSLQRIAAKHFKPDGAFWELCSGYHLYPLDAFCEVAVISHNLSRMDPGRFPSSQYDATDPNSPVGKAIKAALEWFVSMAMPDRTMTVVGDSMAPRAGLDSYATTAEVGYRYFDVQAVGDYEALRNGKRTWVGLLYGAPQIIQKPTPFTSSYLSSGWVSLRNEWSGDRAWVGLNALVPGGGHQHADRLTLTRYAQGKLLALEKATPYNEATTRELGTLSPSHSTVTVDMTSQPQGEALTPEQTPQVTAFSAGPVLKFAEAQADHIYPQTKIYRRSIALIEDIIIDVFRVEGGSTHDWMVNHAGAAPTLSAPTEAGEFEPRAWLAHGSGKVLCAAPETDWTASWRVGDVTSRLTMLGANGTHVFALETYPIDNAVITADHPPCQTLCVRRTNNEPFVAVWDAWRDTPNLIEVVRVGQGLMLKTKSNVYYVLLGSGEIAFPDGVTLKSDAEFSLVRNTDVFAFASGTHLEMKTSQTEAEVHLNEKGNAWTGGAGPGDVAYTPCIEYDTFGGVDHPRDRSRLTVQSHISSVSAVGRLIGLTPSSGRWLAHLFDWL